MLFPQMCESCGRQQARFLLSLSLRILAHGGASTSPLLPSVSFLGLPAHQMPGSDSAGLSLIQLWGAREKYSAALENVHTPCTVFPQHHFSINATSFAEILKANRCFVRKGTVAI